MYEFDQDLLEIRSIPWDVLDRSHLPTGITAVCDSDEAARRLAAAGGRGQAVPEERGTDHHPTVANGLYVFTAPGRSGTTHLFAVATGSGQTRQQTAYLYDARVDNPDLVLALDLYRHWFGHAVRPRTPQFSVGSLVQDKGGRICRVLRATPNDYATKYRVELSPGRETDVWEEDLAPMPVGAGGPEEWIRRAPGGAREAALLLTLAKLGGDLTDTVYSHQSGTFLFRAYQFRPVLRLLASPRRRLLIADEVGLGKTVEAGLIWNELESRASLQAVAARRPAPGFRTLVVCPAALVGKWQEEMRNRFGRNLVNLDAHGLNTLALLLRDQQHDEPFAGVTSLPRLRNRRFIETLQPYFPRFDLVIVDEAHHLRNLGTASYRAGEFLDDWADALVFLSATPLNLGQRDLFNLVQLLDETSFRDWSVFQDRLEPNQYLNLVSTELAKGRAKTPDGRHALIKQLESMERTTAFGSEVAKAPGYQRVRQLLRSRQAPSQEQIATARRELVELNVLSSVLTRTRKVDVPEPKAVREAQDIEVPWTPEEEAFYDAVYTLCVQRAQGRSVKFTGQMWLRQAASCIPAMQEVLRRRTADGTISDEDLAALAAELTAADSDPGNEVPADQLALEDAELGSAEAFAALTTPLAKDTKADFFVSLLARLRSEGLNQVMVFSAFVPTVEYLERRVQGEGITCAAIHGNVAPEIRDETIRAFRAGKFDVLILSEVGSEGLDFEFCNALVNYDLPWNPMRVEQRIGRLDRFGQQHDKILIYNMTVPGTIEADIFLRLYNRIGVFQDSVGELEPIMQGLVKSAADLAVTPKLTADERDRRLEELIRGEENKRQDFVAIRDSEQNLLGIDDLLIKDFESANPGRGRYVGPEEIRGLVAEFFSVCGHGLITDIGDGIARISGDKELNTLVWDAQNARAWKHAPGEDTPSRVDGRQPYHVALTSEAATKSGYRLLNLRHPLVRTAHWYLDRNRDDVSCYNALLVPGLPADETYLATVRSVAAVGVHPRRELWGAAIDVATGEVVAEVSDAVLTALARGALQPWPETGRPDLAGSIGGLLDAVTAVADRIEHAVRADYAAQNTYLVGTRTREVEAEFSAKIARDRAQAERHEDARVRQLFAGKAEANERRCRQQLEVLRKAGEFSFDSTTIALLLVRGV